MEALRRQISSNTYDADDPRVVPIREDKRYRSWTDDPQPQANAVVIYMMDVSGSMTDEQKQIVRTEAFWIDTWLESQYDGVEAALHHPRRRGQGGRRRDVLPHPRKRRHADQLGLQGLRRTDQAAVSARRSGTSTASSSPTATTGAKTTSRACELLRDEMLPHVEPVLLRPGRKPLRQRRVHPRAASRLRRRQRKAGPRGNREQRRHLRLDQGVSGKRRVEQALMQADRASRPT